MQAANSNLLFNNDNNDNNDNSKRFIDKRCATQEVKIYVK